MEKEQSTLLEARKNLGLTQEQLASKVGINRASLSHIERGSRKPSLPLAIKLAAAVNKTVEEIFLITNVA